MGMYKYVRDLWKQPKKNMPELWRSRLIEWRKGDSTVRVERPELAIQLTRTIGIPARAKKPDSIEAPTKMKRAMHVVLILLESASLRTCNVSLRSTKPIIKAVPTPSAAASVGVTKPPNIPPNTIMPIIPTGHSSKMPEGTAFIEKEASLGASLGFNTALIAM